jgi:hypothetical protein
MVNKAVHLELSFNHELIATTFHESGHTITGLLNFLVISEVGIEMTKENRSQDLGFTDFDSVFYVESVVSQELSNKLLINEIRLNYGGLAAEKIFYKDITGSDKLPMVLKSGSFTDRDRVSEIVKKHCLAAPGKKRHAFKQKLFAETRSALEEYWIDVKLVSHTLFLRRKLVYSDLKELLTKKSHNKTFWKQQFRSIELIRGAGKTGDESTALNIISSK